MEEKISIVTVCYNSAATIEKTIVSVQQQTYKNIEHIIVDGCSRDGTIEIVKKMLSDKVVFISEPDNGIYDAMNKGINCATGAIVGILNSDDVFFNKDVLSKVAKAFAVHNTDVVFGDIVMSNRNDLEVHVRKWIAGKKKIFCLRMASTTPGVVCKEVCLY